MSEKKRTLFNNIITLDSTDSTNTYIREQVIACEPLIRSGTVVIARNQTNGRGRKDRSWFSGKNQSLTFSFLLDISQKSPSEITTITLAAGIAVAKAMKKFSLVCKVKWPNDIYIDDKKLCGILSETVNIGDCVCAICGIGININLDNQALKGIVSPATSIYAETAKRHKPEDVLPIILKSLNKYLNIWLTQPTSIITKKWMKMAYGLGKGLQVIEEGRAIDEGFFVGLGEKGQFLLRKFDGSIKEVWVGDIVWDKNTE